MHNLLAARNRGLSRYWLRRTAAPKELLHEEMKRVLVIDCADDFYICSHTSSVGSA